MSVIRYDSDELSVLSANLRGYALKHQREFKAALYSYSGELEHLDDPIGVAFESVNMLVERLSLANQLAFQTSYAWKDSEWKIVNEKTGKIPPSTVVDKKALYWALRMVLYNCVSQFGRSWVSAQDEAVVRRLMNMILEEMASINE